MTEQNPMVSEVNRLIGDLLAGGERLLLPGVGSLRPITRRAYRISKKEVMPPMRTVEFSSEERGLSIVDRVAVAAACTNEEAQEVYRRWLSHTRTEEALTIAGVGVLKQRHFKVEKAFDERLNPGGRKPVQLRRRRRFDWMIALGVVAILATGVIGWYLYQLMQQKPTTQVEPIESSYVKAEQPADTIATQPAVAPVATPTPQPVQTATPTEGVQRMSSGWSYVVLGVFSSEENARRAAQDAATKRDALACTIYHFGQKWMVSPHGSADAASAQAFRKAHADIYPDLWVYQAK